ncbi:MAG: carboxypeptidase-like regulatory domain-containing protein [Candidatus Saccharimonadales bacterium]
MLDKAINIITKHPIISGLVIVLALTLPALMSFISTYGKTEIEIVVAPSDASIETEDKRLKNGINHLSPGEYQVSVSRDGFESATRLIAVVDGEYQIIPIALTPITDEAFEIMVDDPAYLDIEFATGEIARMEGEEFRQQQPIVENLPHRGLLFDIDYRLTEGSDTEIVLQITADSEIDRQYALDQIRNWGFEPEDFAIEYL